MSDFGDINDIIRPDDLPDSVVVAAYRSFGESGHAVWTLPGVTKSIAVALNVLLADDTLMGDVAVELLLAPGVKEGTALSRDDVRTAFSSALRVRR